MHNENFTHNEYLIHNDDNTQSEWNAEKNDKMIGNNENCSYAESTKQTSFKNNLDPNLTEFSVKSNVRQRCLAE